MITKPKSTFLLVYRDWFFLLALLVVIVALLGIFNNQYLLSVAVIMMIDAIAAIGLAPLVRSGDASFATGGLMAVGTYIAGMLSAKEGWSLLATMPLAIIGAGIIAWLLSLLVLRLEGYYLALGTLVFNLIIVSLLLNVHGLGGVDGVTGIPNIQFGSLIVNSNISFLITASVTLLIVAFILFPLLHRGVVGTLLDTIQGSNILVRSLGREPGKSKQFLFVISGCVAGLAGSLYAAFLNYINPEPFGIMLSVHILLIAVIGGTAAVYGPLLGAISLFIVDQLTVTGLEFFLGSSGVGLARFIVYGILLVLVIILLPKGLVTTRFFLGMSKKADQQLFIANSGEKNNA
jgi:branched-chain amino acid transport system permease protein